MANELSGNTLLLKVVADTALGTGASRPDDINFTTVSGFQSNNFDFSATVIDVTNKSSLENMEILERRGIISLTVSGSGFIQSGSLTQRYLEDLRASQNINWFSIERGDGRTYYAKFKLSSFSVDGSYDGAVNFSMTLNSSGQLVFRDQGGDTYSTAEDRIIEFNNLLDDFDVITLASPEYSVATLPSVANRRSVLETFLGTQTILNANAMQENYDVEFNLPAAQTQDRFVLPIFLLQENDLVDRTLQVLETGDIDITISANFITSVDDDTGVTWNAYYLDVPLAMGEVFPIKIQMG